MDGAFWCVSWVIMLTHLERRTGGSVADLLTSPPGGGFVARLARPGSATSQPAPSEFQPAKPIIVPMTSDHIRQRLPNRRYRRLLPAAVAAATIAASAPFATPAHARPVSPKPHKAHVTPPPGKIAALPRGVAIRGEDSQRTSTA